MHRLAWYWALVLLLFSYPASAGDWPSFRGPRSNGVSDESSAPTHWSVEENVKWKVKLPRPGNGSPIVSRGRVFVTSAENEDGRQRSLYCLDAATGKELWVQTVELDKKMPTHNTNPYCASTPVSSGQRVVVWHASAGLHCYSLDGKELWSRDLGEFRHMWGYASSPILHQGNVILHAGPGKRIFVTAIDLENGQTLWETDEPYKGDGDYNENGRYMGSWSTPVVADVDGKYQVIVVLPTRVNGYDSDSGDILWTCEGIRHPRGDLAYSSPTIVGDLCFVTGGGRGPSMAIRLGGSGNITHTHRLWYSEKQPQNIGSDVYVDGYIYRPNAGPGTIQCLDPTTGDVLWTERAEGGNHWASIVMAGEMAYATNQRGTTVVFRPNHQQFDGVAVNKLADPCNSTPAISNGHIYIRTDHHLFCIGP